jgi:hypothetical protein
MISDRLPKSIALARQNRSTQPVASLDPVKIDRDWGLIYNYSSTIRRNVRLIRPSLTFTLLIA